jgi:hypothetical protein
MTFHTRRLGLAIFLAIVTATPGHAGIYGVPTNLDADGTTSGTSVNPPGWFNLDGLGNGFAGGDGVHQMRLMIEVTGTTLDVRSSTPGPARRAISQRERRPTPPTHCSIPPARRSAPSRSARNWPPPTIAWPA